MKDIYLEYWFEMPNRWTFEMPKLRAFVGKYIPYGGDVLIPFAGRYRFPNRLDGSSFYYNDLNPKIKAGTNMEAYLLKDHYPARMFDCIIADPPYSHYQGTIRYDGHQLQSITRWRETADFLLKKGGTYIELGFNSTGLRQEIAEKIALGICCMGGSHNDILIIVQKKIR